MAIRMSTLLVPFALGVFSGPAPSRDAADSPPSTVAIPDLAPRAPFVPSFDVVEAVAGVVVVVVDVVEVVPVVLLCRGPAVLLAIAPWPRNRPSICPAWAPFVPDSTCAGTAVNAAG